MAETTPPTLAQVTLRGLCPRCGAGGLFDGVIAFAPKCKSCGLDYSSFNVGDGAAAFLIFIVAAIVFAGIIVVQVNFNPPWWVHVLLWLPLIFGLTIALLRLSKALLLVIEYKNAAREGKLKK
jgi:uncharacterized protein (DUF983 family)